MRLKSVRTRPLFVMHLEVKPLQIVGATPTAYRRIGVVPAGSFEGEALVRRGARRRQRLAERERADGATTLDVRLVLQTQDGALIGMTYRGIRHGPADVIQRMEHGETVDPASYYFRINALFRKRQRRPTTGSIACSRSASVIAAPTGRCIAFSEVL